MDYLRNLWKRDFFVNIVIWSILIYLAIFFIDKYNLISKLIEIITSVSVGLIVLLIVIICISRLNLIDAYKIKSINIIDRIAGISFLVAFLCLINDELSIQVQHFF